MQLTTAMVQRAASIGIAAPPSATASDHHATSTKPAHPAQALSQRASASHSLCPSRATLPQPLGAPNQHANGEPASHMPHPGDVNNPHWKPLPADLANVALARFDQDMCMSNHGHADRAMCSGLSMQWLDMLGHGAAAPQASDSSDRLSRLASLDNLVHARIVHNLYRMEHAFGMKTFLNQGDIAQASLAGIASMKLAAEQKGFQLESRLHSDAAPFLVVMPRSGRGVDMAALEQACNSITAERKGVLTFHSTDGAHALGFAKSARDNHTLVFDPNQGEFETHNTQLAALLQNLSHADNLSLVGVNVFGLKD